MDKDLIKSIASFIIHQDGATAAARYIAQEAFEGIRERNGQPYFGHCERVADGVKEEASKPIAYLHDLIEDVKGWTYQDLRDIGFDELVIDGIQAVTKHDDDPYFDEMVRITLTPQAIPVKLSDLRDNSNLLRMPELPTAKHIERSLKYFLAHKYLTDVYEGRTAPGTPFETWMAGKPEGLQNWDLCAKYTRQIQGCAPSPNAPRPGL